MGYIVRGERRGGAGAVVVGGGGVAGGVNVVVVVVGVGVVVSATAVVVVVLLFLLQLLLLLLVHSPKPPPRSPPSHDGARCACSHLHVVSEYQYPVGFRCLFTGLGFLSQETKQAPAQSRNPYPTHPLLTQACFYYRCLALCSSTIGVCDASSPFVVAHCFLLPTP